MLLVTLIQQTSISMITLPEKKDGFYSIEYKDKYGDKRKIDIEGTADRWEIFSCNRYTVMENEEKVKSHVIGENDIFTIMVDEEECIMLSEPVIKERCRYKKLFLRSEDAEITIGKDKNNVICIDNRYVSHSHASIIRKDKKWSVVSRKSRNGTYVNNKRITEAELKAGDVVFILGYKFIIGYDFIATNIHDEKVKVNSDVIFEVTEPVCKTNSFIKKNAEEKERYFYRTVKIREEKFLPKKLKLEAPPSPDPQEKQPLILKLGPSVTMCSGSLMIAGYSVVAAYYRGTDFSYVVPSVIMAGTMMSTAVIWPFVLSLVSKKRDREKERRRTELYVEYINTMRGEIKRIINDESDHMNNSNYLSERCAMLAIGDGVSPDKYLWSKNINDDDFLTLCIGCGDAETQIDLDVPEKKLSMKNDPLVDNLYQLVSEQRKLENVHIPFSLKEGKICGFSGDRAETAEFVRALIVQLTSLYSYDELKIAVIYNKEEENLWSYVKWLPHVWNNDNTFRYVAAENQDIKELSAVLEKEINSRTENENNKNTDCPYFLVIVTDFELSEKLDTISLIRRKYKDIRFSMFTLFWMKNYIDSDVVFDIQSSGYSSMYVRNDAGDKRQMFYPDKIHPVLFDQYIDSIANIRLDLFSERYKLPQMLTFLEMFRVSKVEHLNCLTRWSENDPSKSLQTPIGVNQAGESFFIDLHEKFHGPHGLIAGTTGSGKSETIITFILSLAVNYSPEEVAFLIIDYKGGGLADAFESIEKYKNKDKTEEKVVKLPHLAGTVTNLDGATIERSRISIESELKRRQNLFKTARKLSDEGTMDIYKYQSLRRRGMELEALPHLFIVCDEFAELKTQQPEFMDSLVSTARIGRSLGVHLILATQKPDSVVSPQIWSNSRFKICLKVQDKSDSSAVIHRPDAAEISTTGRFYLQVGYNELFSLGQSAWCGADYFPQNSFVDEKPASVEIISPTGTVICEKRIKSRKEKDNAKVISQLVAIRQYLISTAGDVGARSLWLSPLSSTLSLRSLYSAFDDKNEEFILEPVIGKWDDLYERKQEIMTVPFSREGNVCVYGSAGSGSDMFFISLIYSLVYRYSPEQVNIYIMDFDSGFLEVFKNAPSVGDIVFSDQREEVIKLLVSLRTEINKRSKLFSAYGGDYSDYCRRSGKSVPNIVLFLNNYASFAEEYDTYMSELIYLSREGIKRGIYLVVGTTMTNINSRLKQNLNQNFVLRMNDKSDYNMILGRTDGIVPSEYIGRGLVRYDKKVYEFQTADIFEKISSDTDDPEIINDPVKEIERLCILSKEKYRKDAVSFNNEKLVRYHEILAESIDISSVPVGMDTDKNEIYNIDFSDKYITFVSSDSEEKLTDFGVYIAGIIAEEKNIDVVVLDPCQNIRNKESLSFRCISGADELEKWQKEYHAMYMERDNALYKDENEVWRLPCGYRNVYIVVNSFESMADYSINCAARLIEAMLGCEIHNIHYIVLDTPEKMVSARGCYSRVIERGKNDKSVFGQEKAHEEWFDALGIWLGKDFDRQILFEVDNAHLSSDSESAVTIVQNKSIQKIINLFGGFKI